MSMPRFGFGGASLSACPPLAKKVCVSRPWSRSARTMSEAIYSPGLEGVIAGETAVSTIESGLRYRGYPVGELVENAGFDEVAFLLLHGDLPNRFQLASFQRRLAAARSLPHPLLDLLRVLPPAISPM